MARTDQAHRSEPGKLDSSKRLISADRVEGTTVYDAEGEKLGVIEDIMIDKLSGRVAYAVMSFGGFLGVGDHHHPLPWQVLHYDPDRGGYVVDLDRRVLEGAPSFSGNEKVDWEDESWGKRLHDYYRVPPYWI